jgi:hypothetical protein
LFILWEIIKYFLFTKVINKIRRLKRPSCAKHYSKLQLMACTHSHSHRYGRHKNRVTILLNDQIIIVYTCKPHINVVFRLMGKIVTQFVRANSRKIVRKRFILAGLIVTKRNKATVLLILTSVTSFSHTYTIITSNQLLCPLTTQQCDQWTFPLITKILI